MIIPAYDALRLSGSLWSVRSAEWLDAASRLQAAGVTALHWDTTDGDFAAPGGFDAASAARITQVCGAAAEAHLMVHEPLRHVDAWTEFCDIIAVHVEANHCRRAVRRIEARGSQAAVAISPRTPVTAIKSADLNVLVMSVEPGGGGTPFQQGTLARVRDLTPRPLLGIDGGVTADLAAAAVHAGASWIVSGSSLLGVQDPSKWIAQVISAYSVPQGNP